MLGSSFSDRTLDTPAPQMIGAGIGFLVWLTIMALLWRGMRARAESFTRWLVVAGLLGIGLLPLGPLMIVRLNQWFDPSPAKAHRVALLDRGGGNPFRIRVQSWRSTEPSLWFDVDSEIYEVSVTANSAVITTHRGWLGWEWVQSISVVK